VERGSHVQFYFRALEESLIKGWRSFHNERQEGIYGKLALLHPDHLRELNLSSGVIQQLQITIQGERVFPRSGQHVGCRADDFWGYRCQMEGPLQWDHVFPYSLGGPTLPGNRIGLCRYHNMVKSSDIHCYPWDKFDIWAAPWIDAQIGKIERALRLL
jgi:hypothetical protein